MTRSSAVHLEGPCLWREQVPASAPPRALALPSRRLRRALAGPPGAPAVAERHLPLAGQRRAQPGRRAVRRPPAGAARGRVRAPGCCRSACPETLPGWLAVPAARHTARFIASSTSLPACTDPSSRAQTGITRKRWARAPPTPRWPCWASPLVGGRRRVADTHCPCCRPRQELSRLTPLFCSAFPPRCSVPAAGRRPAAPPRAGGRRGGGARRRAAPARPGGSLSLQAAAAAAVNAPPMVWSDGVALTARERARGTL